MVNPEFDWPPDIEASIQEHVRQHIRRGLKRHAWAGVHAELRANVPRIKGRYWLSLPEPNISEWFHTAEFQAWRQRVFE
eukprot:3372145-Prymnesium_polylepis.1